jgi:hypothetical protein
MATGTTSVQRVPGGVRVELTIPDPPPVPPGFRWVGWDTYGVDYPNEQPDGRPDQLEVELWQWLWGINENAPVHALAVSTDGRGDWLGTSYNLETGAWDEWMPTDPDPVWPDDPDAT